MGRNTSVSLGNYFEEFVDTKVEDRDIFSNKYRFAEDFYGQKLAFYR